MVSLCSLYFVNMKCKIFEDSDRFYLEEQINKFIADKEVSISFSTSTVGYSTFYTAIVYWEEYDG